MDENRLRQEALASAYEYAKKHRYEGEVAEAFINAFVESFEQGYKEEGIRITKNLLKHSIDINLIAKISDLSIDEIKALQY